MSVSTCVRRYSNAVAHGLELDAGVEQALDDPQLQQIAIAVQATAATTSCVGERRTHRVGARPIVELAVRDADNRRGLRTAETLLAHPAASDLDIRVTTAM